VRIDRIETALYRVPTRRPVGNAFFTYTGFEYVTARVFDMDGASGFGWSYTLGIGGRAVKALLEELAQSLIGREMNDPREIHAELVQQLIPLEGITGSLAVAPLDVGLWDLQARRAGLPLHELVGARRETVPACATGIDLNYTREELVATVGDWVDRGYPAVKVKVGKPDPAEDVDRVAAVRDRIGPGVSLMVDANEAWTVADALSRIATLRRFDLEFVEDPLPLTNSDGYRQLRRETGVQIAGGERFSSPTAAGELMAAGGLDVLRADICRLGGVSGWLVAAEIAASFGVLVAPHMVEELALPLSCTIDNAHSVEHVPCCNLAGAGVVVEQPGVENGVLTPSNISGHGVVFDDDVLATYQI
jgi:L-alanine-DL-glutamate epimerase-like enolase superfamily enzyme